MTIVQSPALRGRRTGEKKRGRRYRGDGRWPKMAATHTDKKKEGTNQSQEKKNEWQRKKSDEKQSLGIDGDGSCHAIYRLGNPSRTLVAFFLFLFDFPRWLVAALYGRVYFDFDLIRSSSDVPSFDDC